MVSDDAASTPEGVQCCAVDVLDKDQQGKIRDKKKAQPPARREALQRSHQQGRQLSKKATSHRADATIGGVSCYRPETPHYRRAVSR